MLPLFGLRGWPLRGARWRLLPAIAVAQAAGIWLADRGWLSVRGALAWGALAMAIAVAGGIARPRVRRTCAVATALAAGALALASRLEAAAPAGSWEPAQASQSAASTSSPTSSEFTIEATVADRAAGPGWIRVDLRDVVNTAVAGPVLPKRIRLFERSTPSSVTPLEAIEEGARVRAGVRLRPFHVASNPGSNSSPRASQRAGLGALGRLVHPSLHVVVSESGASLRARIRAVRERAAARLARAGPGSELVRALAVGDRSELTARARRSFRQLGLSHLLAVSGLHLSLVAATVFAGVGFLARRAAWLTARADARQVALAAAVAAALGYALFAGWGVPVRRALVFLAALAWSVSRARPGARAEPLALAAIAVLTWEPDALFDPGAQLSFVAAGAIAFSAPLAAETRADLRPAWLRSVRDGARTSACAMAATAPLAAWQFGSTAPFGLVANTVAIPWSAFALLPLSLAAALAVAVAPGPSSDGLAHAAARVAEWSLGAVGFAADWLPGAASFHRPAPGFVALAALVACVAVATRGTLRRVAIAVAVTALLRFAPAASIAPAPPRLVALEVGQGSATIVQGRRGAVLVDAGGALAGGDQGERAVVPALGALGIRVLDLIAVSHGDLDHRAGVPSVLASVPTREVWIPPGSAADPAFSAIVATSRARGVTVVERGAGLPPVRFGDLAVQSLWPPADGAGAALRSRNDGSLVLRIEIAPGGVRVLVPGDITAEAEQGLLARGADVRADVLVLPHHGSRSSSSRLLLDGVDAVVGVASAPCRGRFGMPHPEVLERARAVGTSVWWTGRDGAVIASLEPPLSVWGFASNYALDRFRCRSGLAAGGAAAKHRAPVGAEAAVRPCMLPACSDG